MLPGGIRIECLCLKGRAKITESKIRLFYHFSELKLTTGVVFFPKGPGVAGYLTAGTTSSVMPNIPPPVDNEVGDSS